MYTQQRKKDNRGGHASDKPAESTLVEAPELGQAISLQDILRTIRRWFWVIVLVDAVLTAAVLGYGRTQTPTYEASMTILVGQNSGLIQTPNDATGLKDITETMAQAVISRPVAEAVIRQLNLQASPQDLLGKLSAAQIGKTQFVRVTYRDTSAQNAQTVVNTVGRTFSQQVAELQSEAASTAAEAYQQAYQQAYQRAYQRAGETGEVSFVPPTPTTPAPTITATVWEQAETPGAPVSPKPKRDVLLALGLGLMPGLGLALLLERLTSTRNWRSPDEVEQVSGVPTIGIIPK